MIVHAFWPSVKEHRDIIDNIGQIVAVYGGPPQADVGGAFILTEAVFDEMTGLGILGLERPGYRPDEIAVVIRIPRGASITVERTEARR